MYLSGAGIVAAAREGDHAAVEGDAQRGVVVQPRVPAALGHRVAVQTKLHDESRHSAKECDVFEKPGLNQVQDSLDAIRAPIQSKINIQSSLHGMSFILKSSKDWKVNF